MTILGGDSWAGYSESRVSYSRNSDALPTLPILISLILSIVFLTIGIICVAFYNSDNAYVIANIMLILGFIALCVTAMLFECKLIFEDWIQGNRHIAEYSHGIRDYKGGRLPISEYTSSSDLSKCTVLTLIDLASSARSDLKMKATALIPDNLWPCAIRSLLQSNYPTARIAAVRCKNIYRKTLIKVCKYDPDVDVRTMAIKGFKKAPSKYETKKLSSSRFPDIRLFAVQSITMPRTGLLKICRDDTDSKVRSEAWERIPGPISDSEATDLLQSPYSDIRSKALLLNLLRRKRRVMTARYDQEANVRELALGLIRIDLTRSEANTLSRSKYPDVRIFAIRSGLLTIRGLKWLSLFGGDKEVKSEARAHREQS